MDMSLELKYINKLDRIKKENSMYECNFCGDLLQDGEQELCADCRWDKEQGEHEDKMWGATIPKMPRTLRRM